jgi:hypothetical protein
MNTQPLTPTKHIYIKYKIGDVPHRYRNITFHNPPEKRIDYVKRILMNPYLAVLIWFARISIVAMIVT